MTVELAALVPRYRHRLAPMVRRVGVRAHDVDDVLQDAALAIFRSGVQPIGASPLTVIYRATWWAAKNQVRGYRRAVDPIDYPVDDNAVVSLELGETLARMNRLPLHLRTAITRRAHGFKTAEIATEMDYPPATINAWIREGRQTLKPKR